MFCGTTGRCRTGWCALPLLFPCYEEPAHRPVRDAGWRPARPSGTSWSLEIKFTEDKVTLTATWRHRPLMRCTGSWDCGAGGGPAG